MPKIDLSQIPFKPGSSYPGKLANSVEGRSTQRLGPVGGLTQYGVNFVRLEPDAASSLRHYHMKQDEFVIVTKGVCILRDDEGDHEMQVGDCAAFPAGEANGHHILNHSNELAEFLVVGTHTPTETAYYSDLDMMVRDGEKGFEFTKQDGSPLTSDIIGDDT